MQPTENQDYVVETLKTRYFELIAKEVIGKTPGITIQADHLENAIKELIGGQK